MSQILEYLRSHGASVAVKIQRDLGITHEEAYAALIRLEALRMAQPVVKWPRRGAAPFCQWCAV